MGLGLLGGKFYPLDFGSPLCRKHLYYFGAGAFSRAAVWQGQRLSMGRDFGFLSGAAVSCFGEGSGLMF